MPPSPLGQSVQWTRDGMHHIKYTRLISKQIARSTESYASTSWPPKLTEIKFIVAINDMLIMAIVRVNRRIFVFSAAVLYNDTTAGLASD